MGQIVDYLQLIPLILALIAGQLMAAKRGFPRPGPVTIGMLIAVALGLILQLVLPGTLELLQRDAGAVGQGQLWRLLTALFVQDGGLAGGLSNLLWLFLIGSVAERI